MPAATEAGYLIAYADLWSNKDNPEGVITLGIAEALQDAPLHKRIIERLRRPLRLKRARVSASLAGEFSAEGEAADSLVPSLGEMFDRLAEMSNGKAILVIDEVQHLATRKTFEDFTAALRSCMDRHRGSIFGVFIGSSQGGLAALFGRTKAPFYQYATRMDFPDLGMGVALHFGEHYQRITGKQWEVSDAFDLFCRRGRSPHYLRALFTRCISYGENAKTADAEVWRQLLLDLGYLEKIASLSPLENAVLEQIASGGKIYSEECMLLIAEKSGAATLSVDKVQNAVRRLEGPKVGLVGRTGHGETIIEDEMLKTWIDENK